MSAIYEVRADIDSQISNEYLNWLKPHMEQVVLAGGFLKADLFREESDSGAVVWVCHYHARSTDDIHKYIREKSAELRADALSRFGSRLRAQRRILVSWT
jgi:hypothetical protein